MAEASPLTSHLSDLLNKMIIRCLETGRHKKLCVPVRFQTCEEQGSSLDFIYGEVDCARHTVWGSTTELGWEEAGGRKPSVCGKNRGWPSMGRGRWEGHLCTYKQE